MNIIRNLIAVSRRNQENANYLRPSFYLGFFPLICSIALLSFFLTYGYLILDDTSDYIGHSRNFFRNQFHMDQSLEFWWPPLYFLLISPILVSIQNQDLWIFCVQSVVFGLFLHEFYFQIHRKIERFTIFHFLTVSIFLFSIPGFLKYFLTPHPEGIYLLFILAIVRRLDTTTKPTLLLLLCALAYLTKYSTISLFAAVSLHVIRFHKNKFVIPAGCFSILLGWFLTTFISLESPQRKLLFLWETKPFDFSGVIQFFLPFAPFPNWSLFSTIIGAGILMFGLGFWYWRSNSVYILFALLTLCLHLATHFTADPTTFFDDRLFLPAAMAISLELLFNAKTNKFFILLFAFSFIRFISTATTLNQHIELYAKSNLLKTPYVQFLKQKEREEGSLCLIFENKNHSSLFENSRYFRLLRIPITAKPDIAKNLDLAKQQGFKECYLVKRHFCNREDIFCEYVFSYPKEKIFSDPTQFSNGADIYRVRLF